MSRVACALLVALAPPSLPACSLLVSFAGLDDASVGEAAPGMADAGDAQESALPPESANEAEGIPPGDEAERDGSLVPEGCFTDSMTTRDLPYAAYDSNINTIESCVEACAYHGYMYAGLQDGIQCYCGNSYGGQGPSSGCTDVCPGNHAEICGGPYANSVYRTSVQKD